jgi:hypothetical protein
MKFVCWISILVLMLGAAPARSAAQGSKDTLTNQDVVDLVKTGLSDDIIVAKVKSSPGKFDTSTAALKDLKAAGVSDAVILAIVQAPSNWAVPAGTADAKATTGSNSNFAHVLIYRPHLVPGGGFYPSISIDDKPIVRISNGKRCSVKVSVGHHEIKSDDKTSMISIDAKGGQDYYISVQEVPGTFPKGKGKLTLVAPEQGRGEYQLTGPVQDERKIAKDIIEPDTDTADSGK